jgi:hypothetical protein
MLHSRSCQRILGISNLSRHCPCPFLAEHHKTLGTNTQDTHTVHRAQGKGNTMPMSAQPAATHNTQPPWESIGVREAGLINTPCTSALVETSKQTGKQATYTYTLARGAVRAGERMIWV